MPRQRLLLALALAILFLTAMATPELAPSIDWWVNGSGGNQMTSGTTSLAGTIAQPIVGTVSGTQGSFLCAGFWCGIGVEYRIYVPLILQGLNG